MEDTATQSFWYYAPGADMPAKSTYVAPTAEAATEAARRGWDYLHGLGYRMKSARP